MNLNSKYLKSLFCTLALSSGISFAGSHFIDGTYTGIAKSHGRPMTTEVTVKNDKVVDINIVEQNDTPRYYKRVVPILPRKIIEKQSTKIDAISGCTNTSYGVIQSVNNAMFKARKPSDELVLQAEEFTKAFAVNKDRATKQTTVRNNRKQKNQWISFKDVDLGKGFERVSVYAGTYSMHAEMEIRLDSPDGPVIATIPLEKAGRRFGYELFKECKADAKGAKGKHDIYVLYKTANMFAGLDWIKFSKPL